MAERSRHTKTEINMGGECYDETALGSAPVMVMAWAPVCWVFEGVTPPPDRIRQSLRGPEARDISNL